MSYLVDSNVLLRLVYRRDAMHIDAQNAYTILRQQDRLLCIVPQNLIEFWAVATRPVSANGLGLTVEEAAHESSLSCYAFKLHIIRIRKKLLNSLPVSQSLSLPVSHNKQIK